MEELGQGWISDIVMAAINVQQAIENGREDAMANAAARAREPEIIGF